MPDITNEERAARCADALAGYNDEYDAVANLIDLLADARHWCDRNGASYADLDRMAYQHYLTEIAEEHGGDL